MKATALSSRALLLANKAYDDLKREAADALTPPPKLTNEKAAEWHDKQATVNNYFIASMLQDYFTTEKANAKKRMETYGVLRKGDAVTEGSKAPIFEGALATVFCKVANAAKSIKRDKLIARLQLKCKLSLEEAEEFADAVTQVSSPAKSYEVLPNAGD